MLRKEKYIFLPWKYIFPCLGQGKIYFPGPRPGKIYFPGLGPGKYILASYFWFFYFSKKNSIIFFQNDKYILRNKYKNASHFYFISQNIFIILKKDSRILFGKMKNIFGAGGNFSEFPLEIRKISDILAPWCLPVKTLLFDFVGKMALAPGFFRFYIFFHYFLLKIVQKTAIWAGFLHPFSDPMSLSGPIEHICSMGPHFRFSTLFAKNLSPPKYLYIFISPRYFSWRRAAPSTYCPQTYAPPRPRPSAAQPPHIQRSCITWA